MIRKLPRNIKLCLIKSEVMMTTFVKKLQHNSLPNFKYLHEMEPAYNGKRFHSLAVPL
jgi:hypothetical protein